MPAQPAYSFLHTTTLEQEYIFEPSSKFIRLAYILSSNDNYRLAAILYADAIKYENRCKDIRKVSSRDKTTLPGYENYDEDFLTTIDQRIQEARTTRQSYRMKLNELKPEEFLDEKENLLKSGEICKKLSLIYICKKLDEAGIHDPILASHLHSYTHIYSALSEHAHISTVYLASTVHTDEDSTTRIGTISEDKNEYGSVRPLVSAYLLLMEIFLIAKKAGNEKENAISSLRNSYRANINDFAQYLAD